MCGVAGGLTSRLPTLFPRAAYFNDSQRQATKDAGKIAGLEVRPPGGRQEQGGLGGWRVAGAARRTRQLVAVMLQRRVRGRPRPGGRGAARGRAGGRQCRTGVRGSSHARAQGAGRGAWELRTALGRTGPNSHRRQQPRRSSLCRTLALWAVEAAGAGRPAGGEGGGGSGFLAFWQGRRATEWRRGGGGGRRREWLQTSAFPMTGHPTTTAQMSAASSIPPSPLLPPVLLPRFPMVYHFFNS